MIFKKIYEHAKLHVDGDFPMVHALRWVNEAIRLVATTCDTGSVKDNMRIVVDEPNKWHTLPSDVLGVIKVSFIGEETNDYKEDVLRIFLPEVGAYDIEYKRLPKEIVKESEIPEIHELYHFPLSYWIASREQFRFNPDNADGQRLEVTFYGEIRAVDSMLKKTNRVRKIKV